MRAVAALKLMSGKAFLDTNIVISVWQQQATLEKLLQHFGGLSISLHVFGELHYGACKYHDKTARLIQIELLCDAVSVISPTIRTAQVYGEVKAELSRRGQIIPNNDVWIAAYAIQYGLPLITRDAHFCRVSGLEAIQWSPS